MIHCKIYENSYNNLITHTDLVVCPARGDQLNFIGEGGQTESYIVIKVIHQFGWPPEPLPPDFIDITLIVEKESNGR